MFTIMIIPLRNQLVRRCYSAFAPETILSEENKRKTIAKFARMKSVNKQPNLPTMKNASVLIPLCIVNDKVSLLYTLRAADLKSHRAQVSFPGGMQDSSDKNAEETALRETEEELGMKQEEIELWGKGNVVISRGITSVLPVIGFIKNRDILGNLKINPKEVKEVFTVPLEVLCDPKKVGHTQFKSNYSLPVYTGGKRRIWGLTAVITHLFLRALVPAEFYNHTIKFIPPLRRTSF